jgi:plastocyanin
MRLVLVGLLLLALGLSGAALLAGPSAGAETDGTLQASVGPGFVISLEQDGTNVDNLAPGTYAIDVSDQSAEHNFHLTGPGVDQATQIADVGTTTWTVTFTDGTYRFVCDAHSSIMKGSFTVGAASTTTTTVAPPPLAARIGTVHPTRKLVTAKVSASAAGRGLVQLLAGTVRKARVVLHVSPTPATARLKPALPLKAGRYVVKLTVTAGTRTAIAKKTIRIL